jgi:hypothetical protein
VIEDAERRISLIALGRDMYRIDTARHAGFAPRLLAQGIEHRAMLDDII